MLTPPDGWHDIATSNSWFEACFDWFFWGIKFCFDFMTDLKILGVPALYISLALIIIGIVMRGLLNQSSTSLGKAQNKAQHRRKDKDKK